MGGWSEWVRPTDKIGVSHDVDDPQPDPPPSGGAWALPILALGLGLIACGVIIPAADENRAQMYERARLQAELEGLDRQVALNAEFLHRIHADRELAERLASRQSGQAGEGMALLRQRQGQTNELGRFAMSPFALVATEPKAGPPGPVSAPGGQLASWCRNPRTRLGVLGTGLFACMIGLLGGGSRAENRGSDPAC